MSIHYARTYVHLHFLFVCSFVCFYFFFGVAFESALDPERPFSVLSIPDEVTRHSLLQKWNRDTV